MKEIIKKWIVFWLSAWLTMLIIWISYATWVNITNVTTWQTLDASLFNNIIDNQKDLDTRLNAINPKSLATAWVLFWKNWNIISSYNVSSVIRDWAWLYTINFANALDNSNYVINWVTKSDWTANISVVETNWTSRTTSYVKIWTSNDWQNWATPWDIWTNGLVEILIFWWKN